MSAERPQQFIHKGLIVPWVARWTAESIERHPLKLMLNPSTKSLHLQYEDERPGDRIEGVLWMRSGDARGEGEPEWKEVHSRRQRACMLDPRCQICGMAIEGGVIPWLLPKAVGNAKTRHGISTMVPPVCPDCIPVALASCPFLARNEVQLFEVRHYRPWAYFADYVTPQGRHLQGEIPFDAESLVHIVARQIIVELLDMRRRPLPI